VPPLLPHHLHHTQTVKKEKALIRKNCKNCGEEFETYNDKKETCSDKCRTAFNRRKNEKL